MGGNEETLSMFRRASTLFISGLTLVMITGGLYAYFGPANSIPSRAASLLISGVGTYVLKPWNPAVTVYPFIDTARAMLYMGIRVVATVLKHLIRALLPF